ncbi:MAG: sulfate transporter [Prevotella sp.]
MDNFGYYVAGLILLIVGFLVMKKVASCMIKTVVTLVLVAALAVVYYLYLR